MFFYDWPLVSSWKISGLSVQPFSFFVCKKMPYLSSYLWGKYLSTKIFTVLHQSKKELSDWDQNWAKTRPLLFKTFEISNAMDSHIVQWSVTIKRQRQRHQENLIIRMSIHHHHHMYQYSNNSIIMIVTLTMHVLVILLEMCVCYMVTCIQLSMTPAGVIYTCVRVYILMNIIYSYSSGFIYSVYSSTVFNPVLRIFSWLLWNGISGELWWVTIVAVQTMEHMETYGNIWKHMETYGNIWKYMETMEQWNWWWIMVSYYSNSLSNSNRIMIS